MPLAPSRLEVRTNLEESQAKSVRPVRPFSLQSPFSVLHAFSENWPSSPWKHSSNVCTSVVVCTSSYQAPIPLSSNQVDVLGVLPSE